MQTASEIQSAIKNIKYYSQKIKELSKRQFDNDYEQGNRNGINVQAGTIRFDSLAAIGAACQWLETYCDNILANLRTAEAQDKKLRSSEEEQ